MYDGRGRARNRSLSYDVQADDPAHVVVSSLEDLMRKRTYLRALFVLGLTLAPLSAFAQEEESKEGSAVEGEPGVIYRKKTVVSFEDDTIDGDLTRPDGAYVESRKRVRHSNLIRIREDFREKILDSVSSI